MAVFGCSDGADFVSNEAPTDLTGHGLTVLTQQMKGDTNWRVFWWRVCSLRLLVSRL